jgi:hypothetical protein
MNKSLYSLLFLLLISFNASAQSSTDTTLVDTNYQRLSELKSKLQQMSKAMDEQEKLEVSNSEILLFLQQLDEKITRIGNRQDSLIDASRRERLEKMAANEVSLQADLVYLVVESHTNAMRAAMALSNLSSNFQEPLVVALSEAGKWHYVILKDGVALTDIQRQLAKTRQVVPTAWYISGSMLEN